MQLWFAHGEVTIREQLVTQIVLGILSGDLAPGQRLPSTRELARRFHLHANTVSAGYRQLERDRWVESRRGSGVYVSTRKPDRPLADGMVLDQLIANLFRAVRGLGAPLGTVRSRLRQWLDLQPPDRFLLIEPDEELRRIVVREMQQAMNLPVEGCGLGDVPRLLGGAVPTALLSKVSRVRPLLPPGVELLTLHVRSVPSSLAGWLPAPPGAMVGIASRWPGFLTLARTVLSAAGFHADGLLFRDARKTGWRRGLEQTAAVICDSVTAAEVPEKCRKIPFPLLSPSSIDELRRYQEFLRNPLQLAE